MAPLPYSVTSPSSSPDEEPAERNLRPLSLSHYVGQTYIKQSLSVTMAAAKERKQPLDHILFYGPPGLGKTSLAYLIANEMGVGIRTAAGPAITKAGDLAAILTNLEDGDILFIDEIHRLQRTVEETLYPAMEDRCLDIILGKGPGARSVRIDLPRFTLIGATTRAGSLSHPLRDRFGLIHRLDYYEDAELAEIISNSADKLSLDLTPEAELHIAGRSRKTPRIANRLLKRVRDYAQMARAATVTRELAEEALDKLAIDSLGLDKIDRDVIATIAGQFAGGPVGLETLAAATGEEAETLEDVIEPYLLRIGFIERTPRGRMITPAAYEHLGLSQPIR